MAAADHSLLKKMLVIINSVPADKRVRSCQRHHSQAAGSGNAAVTPADLQQASAAYRKAAAQVQQQPQQ